MVSVLWAEQFLKRMRHFTEKTVIEIAVDLFALGNTIARKDMQEIVILCAGRVIKGLSICLYMGEVR
jgi:hypothetical protein